MTDPAAELPPPPPSAPPRHVPGPRPDPAVGAALVERLFPHGTPRRLDWGCGEHPEPGWLTADLKAAPQVHLSGDIRDGLALPDECLDYVVSVHALPMIPYPDLLPVLAELRRVLRPAGVLRLVLPDLEKNVAAWQRGDDDHFLVPTEDEDTLSGRFIVQTLWYGWSVTPFTAEWIGSLLRRAGFRAVHHCEPGASPSGLPGICDLDNRPDESLFVEAVR